MKFASSDRSVYIFCSNHVAGRVGRIYANDINADTENMLDITDDPDTAPVLKEIMDNPRPV